MALYKRSCACPKAFFSFEAASRQEERRRDSAPPIDPGERKKKEQRRTFPKDTQKGEEEIKKWS